MRRISKICQRGYAGLIRPFAGKAAEPWPMSRGEDIEPVFVVGSGRCGSTLLRRLLIAGDELQIGPELQGVGPMLEECRRSAGRSWKYLSAMAWHHLSLYNEWDDYELSRGEVLKRLRAIPTEMRSAAAMLDAVHRLYGEKHGGAKRWGDKTPGHSGYMPMLHETFPRARYLHALRDGVDVVVSYLKTKLARSPAHGAGVWMDRVSKVAEFQQAHPELVREVRYEELVADPGAYMAGVCEFVGLRWDPAWANRTDHVNDMGDVDRRDWHEAVRRPVNTSAVGRGREGLDPAMRRELAVMNDTLVRFGYEPL